MGNKVGAGINCPFSACKGVINEVPQGTVLPTETVFNIFMIWKWV